MICAAPACRLSRLAADPAATGVEAGLAAAVRQRRYGGAASRARLTALEIQDAVSALSSTWSRSR